ncbi:MAG: seryl-tRNA synthetase, partial [Solirubrobacteraceae bacterium]|nr:seryl-tRNA synthetase [Solirubrobacteraceae bacterium]
TAEQLRTLMGKGFAGTVFLATDDSRATYEELKGRGVEFSEAPEEHERLLSIEEEILQDLEVPYRVVNIAVDDLGSSAAKKYDCEAWLPGQSRYRELTSTSNTTDFQARRLEIRYRPQPGARPEVLHTLNGTAVAVGRTMIALLENGQREDGSVKLPDVLVPYGAPSELPPADPL